MLFGGDAGAVASGGIGALDGQAPSGGSTTFTVTVPGSGMVFNNTITSSADASLQTAITNAEDAIGKNWMNTITLNLSFSAVNEGSTGFLATNSWPAFVSVTYSQLKSALAAHDSGDVYAQDFVASLPATSPIGSTKWALPEAYAKMLGLSSTNYATDDSVTLNTFYLNGSGQDVVNALAHEISEGGMGRVAGDGDQNGVYSTVDLFRYTASGQLDLTDGRDGRTTYFSYNGGATTSQSVGISFNNEYSGTTKVNSGDVGDFTQLDVFGVGELGETFGLSQTDIELMDALGWEPLLVAPTVNLQNVSPAENTAISASSLISSVSNPSGDTITEYIFDDQGRNGHFTFNGTIAPDGTSFAVPVGSLSAVKYIAGALPGADTIVISLGYEPPGSTTTLVSSLSSLTATTSVSSDFNGDGKSDVLWENLASGEVGWNDGPLTAWHDLGVVQTTYDVVATADFTGGGRTDLLWSNPTTGDIGWNDGPKTTWHDLGTAPTSYRVVGTGDFNSDGVRDILWADPATGGVGWNDGPNTAWHDLGAAPTSYGVIGVADFNNDGSSDLIWYDPGAGDIGWNDGPQTSWHDLGVAPTTYQVVGIADFNNDGQPDLVWSDPATGDIGWNDGPNTTWHDLGVAPPGYAVVGTGDYNGDGRSDLLWSNAATGDIGWNDGPNTTWHDLGVAPTSYSVIHFV